MIQDIAVSLPTRSVLFTRAPIVGTNVASLADGTPQTQTWIVPMDGSTPAEVLTNSSFALLSHDATEVLRLESTAHGTAVWAASIISPTWHKLFEVQKGSIQGLRWSPSGDTLVFSNRRQKGYSIIGLWQRGSARLSWVSPGADSDISPVFSPSGKQLAWIRSNDWQQPGPGKAQVKWSVMMANLSEPALLYRTAVAIYRDKMTDLSFINTFGKKNLLFPSEHQVLFGTVSSSGWTHLTRIPVSGEAPTALRSGNCEDSDWVLAEHADNAWAYVSHNCDNLDVRSLERIRVKDGHREALSVPSELSPFLVAGAGFEDWDARDGAPGGVVVLDGYVAWIESTWETPTAIKVAAIADNAVSVGVEVRHETPWKRPEFVRPTLVKFPSADGKFVLHGQLFEPHGGHGTAGMVYTHGGPGRQAFPAFHMFWQYAQEYAVNQWLASSMNITVLSVNYRLSVGYGTAFSNCPRCGPGGNEEYQDVKSAGEVLLGKVLSSPRVKPVARVGSWGLSYGGLNTQQAIARDSHTIWSAGVSWAGLYNWVSTLRCYTHALQPCGEYEHRYSTEGYPSTIGDIQPELHNGWRSLPTGPEPDAATPEWPSKVVTV